MWCLCRKHSCQRLAVETCCRLLPLTREAGLLIIVAAIDVQSESERRHVSASWNELRPGRWLQTLRTVGVYSSLAGRQPGGARGRIRTSLAARRRCRHPRAAGPRLTPVPAKRVLQARTSLVVTLEQIQS